MQSQPKSPPADEPPKDLMSMLICFCNGVPEAVIREAIKNGAKTLDDIKKLTKASTGCGGCTGECERILADALQKLAD